MAFPNQTSFDANEIPGNSQVEAGEGDKIYIQTPRTDADGAAGQSALSSLPTVHAQKTPQEQVSDASWTGAAGPSSPEPSSFIPSVTLNDRAFEFHLGLPLRDNYHAIPAEFTRTPTGSSMYDPESVIDDSGRTYHGYKDGKYFLPNDAAEQDRLDLQHAAIMILFQGEHGFAPIKNTENVLDIATGTGIWALEFAQLHPESNVIGTDLSAIQPIPNVPNCQFIKDDAEEEWLYNGIQFDYVHLRFVCTCFNDPKQVMKNAFDNMKPGGWIEYQESTFEIGAMDHNLEGTALKKLCNLVIEGAASVGRDITIVKQYKQWLIETGFVEVTERRMILPGNPWPEDARLKRVGHYMYSDVHDGIRGGAWKMLKFAGLAQPEIEQLVWDFQEQCGDPQYRWFWPMYAVYGRKPYDSEVNGTASASTA